MMLLFAFDDNLDLDDTEIFDDAEDYDYGNFKSYFLDDEEGIENMKTFAKTMQGEFKCKIHKETEIHVYEFSAKAKIEYDETQPKILMKSLEGGQESNSSKRVVYMNNQGKEIHTPAQRRLQHLDEIMSPKKKNFGSHKQRSEEDDSQSMRGRHDVRGKLRKDLEDLEI